MPPSIAQRPLSSAPQEVRVGDAAAAGAVVNGKAIPSSNIEKTVGSSLTVAKTSSYKLQKAPLKQKKNVTIAKKNTQNASTVESSVANALATTNDDTTAATASNDVNSSMMNNNMSTMYGGGGMMSPYGMGMGMNYGMMGMGMPYGGMMGMGSFGPLSHVTNFLFGFQQLVFALGQAMQMLGMNTQALSQIFNAGVQMFDSASETFNEMRQLHLENDESCMLKCSEKEKEEKTKRKRRLKALRWSMLLAFSYATYKLVYRLMLAKRQRRQRRRLTHSNNNRGGAGCDDRRYPSRGGSNMDMGTSSLGRYGSDYYGQDSYNNPMHMHSIGSRYNNYGGGGFGSSHYGSDMGYGGSYY